MRPGAGRVPELLRRHETLVKYFVIGCTASAIDVGVFLLCLNVLGTGAFAAHSVSVPLAVAFSFLVNARANFRTDDHTMLRFLSFAASCAIGYWVGYGVIALAMGAGLGAEAGKIVSLPVVFVTQYLLNSRITFRKGGAR